MKNGNRKRVHDGFVKVDEIDTPHGKREVVSTTDAVAILLYVPTRDEVVLISQVRLPMMSNVNPEGKIIEVPAGRFDKDLEPRDLIVQEVLEETGITLRRMQVQLLNNGVALATSPGIMVQKDYLAYAEVEEDQIEQKERIFGARGEGERITRLFVPAHRLENMTFVDKTAWALVQWFLKERAQGKGR